MTPTPFVYKNGGCSLRVCHNSLGFSRLRCSPAITVISDECRGYVCTFSISCFHTVAAIFPLRFVAVYSRYVHADCFMKHPVCVRAACRLNKISQRKTEQWGYFETANQKQLTGLNFWSVLSMGLHGDSAIAIMARQLSRTNSEDPIPFYLSLPYHLHASVYPVI